MKRRKYLLGGLVFVFALVISALGWSGEAFAATNVSKGTLDKAILQGVMTCYREGGIKTKINSLADYNGTSFDFMLSNKADEIKIPLVTGWDGSIGDNSGEKFNVISCRELFNGAVDGIYNIVDLFSMFGKKLPSKSESEDVVKIVEHMGYGVKDKGKRCYTLDYKNPYKGIVETNAVCLNNDGTFYASDSEKFDYEPDGNTLYKLPYFGYEDGKICFYNGARFICKEQPEKDKFSPFWLISLVQDENACGKKALCNNTFQFDTLVDGSGYSNAVLEELSAELNGNYRNDSVAIDADALMATKYLGGYDTVEGLLVRENSLEKRLLYQAYLTNYYGLDVECGLESSVGYDGVIRRWLNESNGKIETCYFHKYTVRKKDQKVNGVMDGYFQIESQTWEGLISVLEASEESDEELAKFVLERDNEDLCPKNSGPLGWLLCPVVTAVAGVGESLWNTIESDFMQIPAGQLFDEGGGVVEGWRIVQSIANVAFIILFLVVIFSQLTGVGIDNYGIKKILPKLVVVAVLMNLSLLLCQVAVDLSNVLGSGINNLLTGLAGSLPEVEESSGGAKGAATAVDAMLGGGAVGLFGVLTGGATLAAAAAAVGIAALGIVISVVASIVFMYLILIVRQAGVVLAIVIAPIAIVCYMLPNTEKLYKRWFSLFKALLVVYPICGALIGAGQLAGSVLGSVDNTGMKIAAMLVQVLPFFLIPMLLRNSLSLMGNVGTRLSTWGRQLGRRGSSTARQGIRNTERFKDFSQRNMIARDRRVVNRLGGISNMTEGQRRRYVAASHRVAAAENQREKEYGEIFDRYDKSQLQTELANAMSGKDAERTSAALTSLLKKDGIAEAFDIMDNQNFNWSGMDSVVKNRFLQTMSSTNVDAMKSYAKYVQSGGEASFHDWSRGTGNVIQSERNNTAIKDKTFAAHLRDNGEHAMEAYTKDEMQFIGARAQNLGTDVGRQAFGEMLSNVAINSKNAKAQTAAEAAIGNGLRSGNLGISDLRLTPEKISNMREDTARIICNNAYLGYRAQGMTPNGARNQMRSDLTQLVNGVRGDNRLLNRTNAGVRQVFGI